MNSLRPFLIQKDYWFGMLVTNESWRDARRGRSELLAPHSVWRTVAIYPAEPVFLVQLDPSRAARADSVGCFIVSSTEELLAEIEAFTVDERAGMQVHLLGERSIDRVLGLWVYGAPVSERNWPLYAYRNRAGELVQLDVSGSPVDPDMAHCLMEFS